MDNDEIKSGKTTWVDKAIGERLYKIRREVGITQEELARHLNVSFQQIQKYEKGTNRISASRLYMIARALQVPYGTFFSGWTREEAFSLGEETNTYNKPPLKDDEKRAILNFFSELPSERVRKGLLQSLRDLSRSLRQ